MEIEHEILDESLTKSKSIKRINLKAFIALILLWIGLISSSTSGLHFTLNNIAVVILLFCSTIITFFDKTIGVQCTYIILLLGLFRMLSFFPISFEFAFDLGVVSLGVNYILLVILLIHFILFPRVIRKLNRSLLNSVRKSN